MAVDFSTIIPTFRRPQALETSVRSALGQTGVGVEVIVVDDSPERSAKAVIDAIGDPRVVYLANPAPTGGRPSVVRNLGWPLAHGEFLHFLDDDDRVPDGHYAAVRAAFAEAPGVGLVFGRIEPFGECPPEQLEGERAFFRRAFARARQASRLGPVWGFSGQMLFGQILLVCSASVIRRACVEKVGGFDPSIRLMEDGDFHLRVFRECGARLLDRVSVHYRIGWPSLMHAPNPSPEQRQQELAGRNLMNGNYRKKHGAAEYYALALSTRALNRVLPA